MKRLLALLVAAAISYVVYDSQNTNARLRDNAPRPTPAASANRTPTTSASPSASNTGASSPNSGVRSNVGFRSRTRLVEHYEKHGREFGTISMDTYLAMAQTLRDAPTNSTVLEIVRPADGVVSRFDKEKGAFLAFNPDRTIRTYFKPNDGEAYFRRQAKRPPAP